MKKLVAIIKFLRGGIEIGLLLILLANLWVINLTDGRTFSKISRVPVQNCALVLGTSPKTKAGNANPYFVKRMKAAISLYTMGKVKYIIVSGEKSAYYDEPQAMKQYLKTNGNIPDMAIVEDPKGFSTRESINRCKTVYKENNVVIVSQGYHNLRALFIARNLGMNAYAFDAKDVHANESYYRNHFREVLARVKAVLTYLYSSI